MSQLLLSLCSLVFTDSEEKLIFVFFAQICHLRRPGFFPTREQRREKIAATDCFFVHLSCSAIFLSIFPANVAFRKPGKMVCFSTHFLVIGITAPQEEGTLANTGNPEVVFVPAALVNLVVQFLVAERLSTSETRPRS